METLAKVLMVCWLVASGVQSEASVSPSPDSHETPTPSTVAPEASTPSTVAPEASTPSTVAPETSTPSTVAPESPTPSTVAPEASTPSTVAPEASTPSTLAPETSTPSTVAPESPTPSTVAPESPTPSTVAPESPTPSTVAPETPTPSTVAPEASTPSTLAPETLTPSTVAPETPTPSTVAPESPTPSTVAPETPTPSTVAPETPTPSTVAPETPTPSTVAPETLTPGTSAPETPKTPNPTSATDAPTSPSTTALPDPCISNSCPPNSRCEPRFGNYTCVCLPGLVLEDNICKAARVFPGNLRIVKDFKPEMEEKTSEEFSKTSNEIINELKKVLGKTNGYVTSTVLSLKEGSVIAEVENVYNLSSTTTADDVNKAIANEATCEDCFFKGATLTATDLCSPEACDPLSTTCSAPGGELQCNCKPGYVKTTFTDRSCTICPSGTKAENNKCVDCLFGYSGVNCEESYLLAVVVVSVVLGGLLLILLTVLICLRCRKSKKGSADVKSSPYIDMDFSKNSKIPRASANKDWEPANLEMVESGSTRALVTSDRPSNGTKNYRDPNLSGIAYRTHGHVNPYYENNEDRQQRH